MLLSLCADTSTNLGRLDYASLSQQALMEIVVENITNREKITRSRDAPADLKDWIGVTVTDGGGAIKIQWMKMEGSFQLEWLPSNVQSLALSINKTPGTVDVSKLPTEMTYFNLYANQLFGTFNFSELPKNVKILFITNEKFDGSVDCTRLPTKMEHFCIRGTPFTGGVDLTKLPMSLKHLFLSETDLSGTIDLTKLPPRLESFNVSYNSFSGETDFSKLPESIRDFSVENTNLSGRILCDFYTRKHRTYDSDVKVFVKLNRAVRNFPEMALLDEGNSDTPVYVRLSVFDGIIGVPE